MASSQASKSFIGRLDSWLISPSAQVPELERRDARLITSLSAVLVVAFFLRLMFTSSVDTVLIGSVVAMGFSYVISRTQYRKLSAFIIIVLLLMPILSNLLAIPAIEDHADWVQGRSVWLALPMVLASIFFSWRGTFLIGLGLFATLVFVPNLNDALVLNDMIGSMAVVGILTALLVLAERHRDAVEDDRRAELIIANSELRDARNNLEKRVEERTRDLNVALEAAKRSDEVKSAFLASMSHELRTPLNSVINFTKFVMRGVMGPVTERQEETLAKVIASGQHLLSLINDVLDMSKIESGSLNLFVEDDVDLNTILETVLGSAESLLHDKPVELQTDIQSRLPIMRADRKRVTQIMLNVVSNACKFTEEGFVNVQAKLEDEHLLVSVQDTGPGIPKESADAVFSSFKQTNTGLRQGEGTGLGMPISKSLAEAHGGKLWFESEEGKGATFFVKLPMQSDLLEPTV